MNRLDVQLPQGGVPYSMFCGGCICSILYSYSWGFETYLLLGAPPGKPFRFLVFTHLRGKKDTAEVGFATFIALV